MNRKALLFAGISAGALALTACQDNTPSFNADDNTVVSNDENVVEPSRPCPDNQTRDERGLCPDVQ